MWFHPCTKVLFWHIENTTHISPELSSLSYESCCLFVRFTMLLIENDKYDYDILIHIFILHILIYIKHILNEIFYVLFDFDHENTRTRSIFVNFWERTVMISPPYKSFILAFWKSKIHNKILESPLKYTTTINSHKHLHLIYYGGDFFTKWLTNEAWTYDVN